jgi:hypothetical protein
VLEILARDLLERGKLDLSETVYWRNFRVRLKRGFCVGKTKRGKGTWLLAVADRSGLPVAIYTESASPHEVRSLREPSARNSVRRSAAQNNRW